MPRRIRSAILESRNQRQKLKPRKKPYHFTPIGDGISIGIRINKRKANQWVVRVADGHGGYWVSNVGASDDREEANGTTILSWWEIQDKARGLIRDMNAAGGDRPATVADAFDLYEQDLTTREAGLANARYPRSLLPASILSKPVGMLTPTELRHCRDGLLATREPSSVTRICKAFKACLNLAAAHDSRITNASAWKIGLAALPDAQVARHIGLPERDIRALVSAGHIIGPELGLWIETAATTGARPVQLRRLDVGDLQDDRDDMRVLMPSASKGKGKKRIDRRPVPVPASLAAKLRAAAAGRSLGAPLLTTADGTRWPPDGHVRPFARAAAAAGLPKVTAYALRHSSIIRGLLRGVPARVVAAQHDTSIVMLERNYSAYVLDHSDSLSRRALLDLSAAAAE